LSNICTKKCAQGTPLAIQSHTYTAFDCSQVFRLEWDHSLMFSRPLELAERLLPSSRFKPARE
jgi:hypothetical protein